MHIVYIHQYFKTPQKGGGIRSYEFAKRFIEAGHEVTMVCGQIRGKEDIEGRSRRSNIEGIEVVELPVQYSNTMSHKERVKSFLTFASRACACKLAEKPDIIFATSTPLTVGFPGAVLSMRYRIPFVFEVRDLWPAAPVQMGVIKNPLIIGLLRSFEKYVYRRAEHIIALSPGMVQGVLQRGIPKSKVSMIPNCSDLHLFDPGIDSSQFLEKYGLSGQKIIAYAGAISTANGLDIIIEGAEKLRNREDIEFVLAGEGREKKRIEEQIKSLGLTNITFLGRIPKREVVMLYGAAAACLVLFKEIPILSTNSPNKFFDALAAGRPVITNMEGWVDQLLTDNEAGIGIGAIKEGRGDRLAEAIESLVDNPKRAGIMGRNARQLAEDQFSRNELAGEVLDVLKKCSR